ncbi:hypothetical protein Aduo_008916 [Ancylostoma duodenale]
MLFQFNNGVGGPPVAPIVKALLVCKADQKWYYTQGADTLSLANNAGGCKQMNAVCTATQPGLQAFMEFNSAIGGPVIAETVTSLLTCRDDGKWYFTLGQDSL